MSINIISAKYLDPENTGTNQGVQAIISGEGDSTIIINVPLDTDNLDYQAIQDWVAEGNTIADAD